MNSKGHLILSLLKSLLRCSGCIASLLSGDPLYMAFSFLGAEILGILEELVDRR